MHFLTFDLFCAIFPAPYVTQYITLHTHIHVLKAMSRLANPTHGWTLGENNQPMGTLKPFNFRHPTKEALQNFMALSTLEDDHEQGKINLDNLSAYPPHVITPLDAAFLKDVIHAGALKAGHYPQYVIIGAPDFPQNALPKGCIFKVLTNLAESSDEEDEFGEDEEDEEDEEGSKSIVINGDHIPDGMHLGELPDGVYCECDENVPIVYMHSDMNIIEDGYAPPPVDEELPYSPVAGGFAPLGTEGSAPVAPVPVEPVEPVEPVAPSVLGKRKRVRRSLRLRLKKLDIGKRRRKYVNYKC